MSGSADERRLNHRALTFAKKKKRGTRAHCPRLLERTVFFQAATRG